MIPMNVKPLVAALAVIAAIAASGCTDPNLRNELQAEKAKTYELAQRVSSLETELAKLDTDSKKGSLTYCASDVVTLLADKDMEGLSKYIHPERGVRLSPYTHVNFMTDRVVMAEDIVDAFGDPNDYVWGTYDGSGKDISLTFANYFDDFVYDADFANPDKIGLDKAVSSGNIIDNLKESYPHGKFVEFYYKGTKKNAYMDWSSIKVVFEKVDGKWLLVGIVHGQWTI
jgi:hypothetical protein